MKAVDADTIKNVERNHWARGLRAAEAAAAEFRSKLGLVTREKFQTVEPSEIIPDGVTRMRSDQITRLYEAGKINEDARSAALKMRKVWEAMARGLYQGVGQIGGSGGGKSRGSYRHPLERMTSYEFFIWAMEYKPWANGPAARLAFHTPVEISKRAGSPSARGTVTSVFKRSYLHVCYAVVVDNIGPHQLERQWPIVQKKGAIVDALREGLGHWKHQEWRDIEEPELMETRRRMVAEAKARVDGLLPSRNSP